MLDVQPSGISHILAGRNKPSFDLVQKILRRFPKLNPDWLILDKEPMYRPADADTPAPSADRVSADLFGGSAQPSEVDPKNPIGEKHSPQSTTSEAANRTSGSDLDNPTLTSALAATRGRVKRIIVMFDDHTFESYEPAK